VVSPSSTRIDRSDKFEQYAKAGVKYYWIVDPRTKRTEGYRLVRGAYKLVGEGKGKDTIRLPPFDDLEIPLEELWQPD
jgi:Uma2 family endonuclease